VKIRISALDAKFSRYIRWIRDKGTCQRCGKQYTPPTTALQCSHFNGRRKKSVRFDPENVAAMCHGCHAHLTANPWDHVLFWQKRLGKAFVPLQIRANTPRRPDYKLIDMWLEEEFKRDGERIIGVKA
jgi:hypothetical protein